MLLDVPGSSTGVLRGSRSEFDLILCCFVCTYPRLWITLLFAVLFLLANLAFPLLRRLLRRCHQPDLLERAGNGQVNGARRGLVLVTAPAAKVLVEPVTAAGVQACSLDLGLKVWIPLLAHALGPWDKWDTLGVIKRGWGGEERARAREGRGQTSSKFRESLGE